MSSLPPPSIPPFIYEIDDLFALRPNPNPVSDPHRPHKDSDEAYFTKRVNWLGQSVAAHSNPHSPFGILPKELDILSSANRRWKDLDKSEDTGDLTAVKKFWDSVRKDYSTAFPLSAKQVQWRVNRLRHLKVRPFFWSRAQVNEQEESNETVVETDRPCEQTFDISRSGEGTKDSGGSSAETKSWRHRADRTHEDIDKDKAHFEYYMGGNWHHGFSSETAEIPSEPSDIGTTKTLRIPDYIRQRYDQQTITRRENAGHQSHILPSGRLFFTDVDVGAESSKQTRWKSSRLPKGGSSKSTGPSVSDVKGVRLPDTRSRSRENRFEGLEVESTGFEDDNTS